MGNLETGVLSTNYQWVGRLKVYKLAPIKFPQKRLAAGRVGYYLTGFWEPERSRRANRRSHRASHTLDNKY